MSCTCTPPAPRRQPTETSPGPVARAQRISSPDPSTRAPGEEVSRSRRFSINAMSLPQGLRQRRTSMEKKNGTSVKTSRRNSVFGRRASEEIQLPQDADDELRDFFENGGE